MADVHGFRSSKNGIDIHSPVIELKVAAVVGSVTPYGIQLVLFHC